MINITKYTLRILGMIGLILFIVPIFYEFYNIGTLTGIGLSILLILYSFNYEKWNQWIKDGWKKDNRNYLSFIIQIIASFILILALYTSVLIFQGNRPQTNDNRTVIVLGCEVKKDGTPSVLLESRLKVAKEYLLNHPTEVVIVSGSNMRNHDSEAESAYKWLIENGIEDNRIYKDTTARSTEQNIHNAYQIIKENNLNDKVALATNTFHINRALQTANQMNINATSLEAKTPWWLWPTYYIREMYGILYNQWFR